MSRSINDRMLFRYRVISLVESLILQGVDTSAAVRQVSEMSHLDALGQARRVSRRTLWRWLKASRAQGIEGLARKEREPLVGSRILPADLLTFLRDQRALDRHASIPELLRRAKEEGVITAHQHLDRSTVWRAMGRMGIETSRVRHPQDLDMRRFSYPTRLQMVLSDFKHFRVGPSLQRRVAIYFLDDATRFVLGVVCTTSENKLDVLRCLSEVLSRWGRFGALYVDRGPGYIADDLVAVCARLNLPLIHGQARYPEAHGKIERFNRSLKARTLHPLRGADIDTHCASLGLRLRHDVFEVYNHLAHRGLNGETPHERFFAPEQPALRPIEHETLCEAFRVEDSRLASKDHVISFGGVDYEVPRGLRNKRVTIWRHVLEHDDQGRELLSVHHQGRDVRLHPVDVHFNAVSGRAKPSPTPTDDSAPLPSASSMSFERHLRPMVDAQGGYSSPEEES